MLAIVSIFGAIDESPLTEKLSKRTAIALLRQRPQAPFRQDSESSVNKGGGVSNVTDKV